MKAGPKPRPMYERLMARTHVETSSGCWLFAGAKADKGHGLVGDVSGKTFKAHRVAWEHHNGPIPTGVCVCHKCDIPACVNPDHLFLGTVAENNHDMVRKGRNAVGERSGRAKLTHAQALEVRRLRGTMTQTAIARKFGVTPSNISRLLSGDCWNHLTAGAL